MGYQLSENWIIDAAYSATFFHNRSIHNSVGATTTGVDAATAQVLGVPDPDISGTYKDFANLVAVNLTYNEPCLERWPA